MATRSWPGLGPVFAYEWLTASRRWQGYALRSLLVLLLLLGLSGVWLGHHDGTGELSVRQLAEIGRGFYAVATLILLGLVGLGAPAAAAGAICLDKARGNLTLLFATDLTDAEIVLGKLAARLVPVLGLIACAAPVMALATLLGGVDPEMPIGAILVCLACAVFGCTLALTLSVWGRKTHEVLLATYAFGIFWLLSAPIWAGLVWMLPWWARPACRMTTARIRQVAAAASSAEVRSPSAQNRACAPSPIGPSPGGPPALSGESARKTGL